MNAESGHWRQIRVAIGVKSANMENPNQTDNLEKSQTQPLAAAAGAEPETQTSNPANQEQERLLFFNVMPKVNDSEQIVQPKLKITELSSEKTKINSNFMDFLSKYKVYVILFLAAAITGPAVYYAINKFIISPSSRVENLLQPADPNAVKKKSPENLLNDWRIKYFKKETCDVALCGDGADADHDGLTNLEEFKLNADPNNRDSDIDGLSDGDEANVFQTDPLDSRTAKDPKYSDADFMNGGYDIKTGQKMSDRQIADIKAGMDKFGLHEPSLSALSAALENLYHFGVKKQESLPATTTPITAEEPPPNATTTDQSLSAKQDRDAQRSLTIKNVGIALIKYQTDNQAFPKTSDFLQMFAAIKPYLKVASNPLDPINSGNYIYAYSLNDKGDDYTLAFYSEVASQIIKKRSADAQKDKADEESAIYDNQRRTDLETLRNALLLYSNDNVAGNQDYVFPMDTKYKTELVPKYISSIPKDPRTGKDYEYKVAETFDSFTLKAILDNPNVGTTGYLCNQQDECRDY